MPESSRVEVQVNAPDRIDKIPYLDGLRGCSILTVVVLHCTAATHVPTWLIPVQLLFGNGELGVDIFFVISGFLITTLLIRERDATGSISLRGFYERRVARIFPAAYTYIAVVAALRLLGLIQLHSGAFVAASLFSWNYGEILNLFTGSVDLQVFNHFWSLSLEEQFYLFWPGCLLLFGRRNARHIALTAVVVLPFVRLLSYALFPKSRSQLGAMFHTGVDQIFWGALLALPDARGARPKGSGNRWFGWLTFGYALVVVFVIAPAGEYIHSITRFVSPTAYSSFAAMLLIWLLSGKAGVVRAILQWKPLVWVGLISYSLYVWQQIFLAPKSPIRLPFPINVGCAVLAAICSYYLIETPLRTKIRAFFSNEVPNARLRRRTNPRDCLLKSDGREPQERGDSE
jgi:peptidoglycan/LPS O-acetylase OafA/YrhL